MFREAVLHFLGVGQSAVSADQKYCLACKQAKKDDCDNCNRNIKVTG